MRMRALRENAMENLTTRMLASRTIAVVGATSRAHKYGYKIFRDLLDKGYDVQPVHPAIDVIDGVPVYKTITETPTTPEVACLVVPPAVSEKVVRQCAEIGVRFVWMQPGAESPAAIALCEELGLECVHDQCVMILSGPKDKTE